MLCDFALCIVKIFLWGESAHVYGSFVPFVTTQAVIDFLHKNLRHEPIIGFCYATGNLERAACGACGKSSMEPCVRAWDCVESDKQMCQNIKLLIFTEMQFFCRFQ